MATGVPFQVAISNYGQAFEALDAWTQAPETAPFALLDASLGLDSDGRWLRQALPPATSRAGCG